LAGHDSETFRAQLVMQFGVDEVHLAQVRLCGVDGDARTMLHGDAGVSVTLDAEPVNEDCLASAGLAESMLAVAAHRDDDRMWRPRHRPCHRHSLSKRMSLV
jgi:hypothetical protein